MSGLGLEGLEGHARFPQSGQAGVAELVTGAMGEPGPLPRRRHDLVEAFRGERHATVGSFQHDEESVARVRR